jgi:hypothetical protein
MGKCIDYIRAAHKRESRERAEMISVEVEKPGREGLEELSLKADFVFYSRSWAVVKAPPDFVLRLTKTELRIVQSVSVSRKAEALLLELGFPDTVHILYLGRGRIRRVRNKTRRPTSGSGITSTPGWCVGGGHSWRRRCVFCSHGVAAQRLRRAVARGLDELSRSSKPSVWA